MVFSMMSSNVTRYDANWRFQLDDPDDDYSFVKILTGGGDLLVTNHIEENYMKHKYVKYTYIDNNYIAYTTLERRITDADNKPQLNIICQDCPSDWCSV